MYNYVFADVLEHSTMYNAQCTTMHTESKLDVKFSVGRG